MRQFRPPLKDIMRITGLSRASVDRVMNRREGVRPRTQAAVDAALMQLTKGVGEPETVAPRENFKHLKAVVQAGDAFTKSIVDEVARLAPLLEARDCTLDVIACVGLPSERVAEIIRALVEADGLLIIAKNTPEIADAAITLRDRGKAIVTSHTDLDLAARHAYVGIDNRAAGQTAGFIMGRHMASDSVANVAVVVETMTYRCHEEREMGFRSVIRQRFPSLNLIEVVKYDDSADASYEAIKSLLESHPHIDGIYNTAGGNQGVAKALAEGGRTGKTLFVTHEYNQVTETLIRQNEVDYLITQNMKHMMLEAVDHLNAILIDRPYSQQVTIPLEILCHYSLPSAN